jgi:hypothetical protein
MMKMPFMRMDYGLGSMRVRRSPQADGALHHKHANPADQGQPSVQRIQPVWSLLWRAFDARFGCIFATLGYMALMAPNLTDSLRHDFPLCFF